MDLEVCLGNHRRDRPLANPGDKDCVENASKLYWDCSRNDDILPDLQTSRVYRRSSGFPEKSRRLRRRLVRRVLRATCHAIPYLRISANQLFQPHPSISPTSTSYFYFCAYLPTNCAGHQHPAHSLQLFLEDFFQTGSSDIGPSQVSQTLWADGWGDRLSLVENTTTLQLRTSKHFSPQTFLTRSSEMNTAPTILGPYILQGGTDWVWLRTQKLCRTSTLLTQQSAMQKISVSSIVHLVIQIHTGTIWTRETKYSKNNRPWWQMLNRYNSEGHLLPSTAKKTTRKACQTFANFLSYMIYQDIQIFTPRLKISSELKRQPCWRNKVWLKK